MTALCMMVKMRNANALLRSEVTKESVDSNESHARVKTALWEATEYRCSWIDNVCSRAEGVLLAVGSGADDSSKNLRQSSSS